MAEDASTIREAVRQGVGLSAETYGARRTRKSHNKCHGGAPIFQPAVLDQMTCLDEMATGEVNPLTALTEREVEVLRLIADENPTHLIADKLFISVPTVETHRRHLMQKLGVKSVVAWSSLR